jgi:hypothetical protein
MQSLPDEDSKRERDAFPVLVKTGLGASQSWMNLTLIIKWGQDGDKS